MATPSGPASPGNPISYNDIIAESNFAPPAGNNGIYDFATYIYDDGFINEIEWSTYNLWYNKLIKQMEENNKDYNFEIIWED